MIMLYQDRLLPQEQVRISPLDRGYYFGDGVYDVFRVYRSRLFESELHMARLERSAREIRLKMPYPAPLIKQRIRELVDAERLQEGIVYVQITRGEAPRVHGIPEVSEPVLIAWCTPVPRPAAAMRDGISAVTRADIRWLRCDIKSLNLLPNAMLKQEAIEAGAGEVILHREGTVTECSASNVMIVRHGSILTHPTNQFILPGVTRAVVLKLAAELGIEARETPFSLDQLLKADEVFITGTISEITPVTAVDGKPVSDGKPGPITRKLQNAFAALLESSY